jgi:type IV secretory pathway TraG/TraD family ATPase VirD4
LRKADTEHHKIIKSVLSADEIFTLEDNGIFVYSGNRPALIKLMPYYKNPRLHHLTIIPPVSYAKNELPELEYLDLKVAPDTNIMNHTFLVNIPNQPICSTTKIRLGESNH